MNSFFKKAGLSISVLLFAVGCQSRLDGEEKAMPLSLTGHVWQLTALAGTPATIGDNNKALNIEFLTEKNTYRGFAGCNNYSGSYAAKDDKLEFGPARATRKYCAHSSTQETTFLQALAVANHYTIVDKTLTITDDLNQILAVFSAIIPLR